MRLGCLLLLLLLFALTFSLYLHRSTHIQPHTTLSLLFTRSLFLRLSLCVYIRCLIVLCFVLSMPLFRIGIVVASLFPYTHTTCSHISIITKVFLPLLFSFFLAHIMLLSSSTFRYSNKYRIRARVHIVFESAGVDKYALTYINSLLRSFSLILS